MWAHWMNSSAPKISLQEILEHDGARHLSGQTKALYTEKTDDKLDNPLIKPITEPKDKSDNTAGFLFSPLYRLWGYN